MTFPYDFDPAGPLLPTSQADFEYAPASSSRPSTASSADPATMASPDYNVTKNELARLRVANDPTLARAVLAGLPTVEKGWCRLCTLKPSKEGGYIQVSWAGANKFALLQELVLWAAGGHLKPGEQCSHLCCEPACVGLDHIIAEPGLQNQNGKGCLGWVDCPHCALKISVCVHVDKKCIKYCAGFDNAAAFEAAGVH